MEPNTQVALSQVVADIVQQSASLAAIVGVIVYGLGEAIKKISIKGKKVPGWVIGVLAAPIGVLTMFLINGAHFTPLGILVGVLAGFSTSGIYSTIKSATSTTTPTV